MIRYAQNKTIEQSSADRVSIESRSLNSERIIISFIQSFYIYSYLFLIYVMIFSNI